MTKVNEKHVGWGFWLWWVLASTIGFPVGAAAAFIVSFNVPGAVGGAVGGAVVGILQWLVLRQQLSRTGWWVLASTVGIAVFGDVVWYSSTTVEWVITGGALSFTVAMSVGFAVGGAVVGILQWLVLRQHLSRAGWWVLASTVGFPVGAAVYVAVFQAVNLALGGDLSAAFIERAMGFAVAGAVVGAITGTALVWLLRQPKLEE